MKRIFRIIITIQFICLFANYSFAQKQYSLRTSAGFAGAYKIVEGFNFGFDIGIPIIKSIEIAPTFNYVSIAPNKSLRIIKYSNDFPEPSIITGNLEKGSEQNSLGSASILVYFKPLDWLKDSGNKKSEIGIGTGFGVKSGYMIRVQTDNNGDVWAYQADTGFSFLPFFLKVYYNYHLSNQVFVGFNAGLDEGKFSTGGTFFALQFGVNFSKKKKE